MVGAGRTGDRWTDGFGYSRCAARVFSRGNLSSFVRALPMNTQYLLNYVVYMGTGIVLLALFVAVYVSTTPYHEFKLIREGNVAAALSFGGALVGFSLALCSSALHANDLFNFAGWAALSGLVQLVTYFALSLAFKGMRTHIENGNCAVGGAALCASVAIGALNAASLA